MFSIRNTVRQIDVERVRALVAKTGVFSEEEIDIAAELVAQAQLEGEKKSGYSFYFFEQDKKLVGYSCYGRVPLTESSYDLYWLAVDTEFNNKGIAKRLLDLTETAIRADGGTQLYAETSSMDTYKPARFFYQKYGFEECARQTDFYKKGDDKITYVFRLLPKQHH
jgi:ribosomal protein S18 acetylase RimI-like enzyme